jgi:hypothetical protein
MRIRTGRARPGRSEMHLAVPSGARSSSSESLSCGPRRTLISLGMRWWTAVAGEATWNSLELSSATSSTVSCPVTTRCTQNQSSLGSSTLISPSQEAPSC